MEHEVVENKFLGVVKSLKKYNPALDINLYRVGGCVRDKFLGLIPKDIDYLVTNIEFNVLLEGLTANLAGKILSTDVGDSMNVIKVALGDGEPYDFAIPRKDIYGLTGDHCDLVTIGDPSMSVEDDLSRRDITINAMAENVETGELVDPFGGMNDIHRKIIRAVGEPSLRFREDALRILRIVQFRCRFGFTVDDLTLESMREHRHLLKTISGERVFEEFKKAFIKSCTSSNTEFMKIITYTKIGEALFGEDWYGTWGLQYDICGDKVFSNIILMFLRNESDFTFLKMPKDLIDAVKLARDFWNAEDHFSVFYKRDRYYQELKDALHSCCLGWQYDWARLDAMPKKPSDLNISSEELMSMGINGRMIGIVHRELCRMIYEEGLNNTREFLAPAAQEIAKKCS